MEFTYHCYAIKLNSTGELRPLSGAGGFATLSPKGEKQIMINLDNSLERIKLFATEKTAQHALVSTAKSESIRYGYTQEEYKNLFSIIKIAVTKDVYDKTIALAEQLKARNIARNAQRGNSKKSAIPKFEAVEPTIPVKCGPKPLAPISDNTDDPLCGVTLSTVFSAIVRTEKGRVSVSRYRTPEAALRALMKKVDLSYLLSVRIISETIIKAPPHC